MRVAIDGPAGAGKSTVARKLADRLGFLLVDTGALYRSVALAAARADIAWDEEDAVGALAEALAARGAIRLEPMAEPERSDAGPSSSPTSRVMLDGVDVSRAIRAPEMSLGASRVSAIPRVRAALLDLQRKTGDAHSVVLEGRDIGTVVFPDAEVKFFLTAPAPERARRRHAELLRRGDDASFDATLRDVEKRDRADTERPIAPLKRAEDALLVDSEGKTIDEVVDLMVRVVRERLAR